MCDEVYTGNPRETQLVRISASGKLLGKKEVGIPEKSTGFTKITQINQNLFALAGFQESNDSSYLWLYKMDSLFNEVQSRIFSLGNYTLYTVTDLIINNEKIICSGTCEKGYSKKPFIYKISQSFDSIQLRIFTETGSPFPPDVLVKKNNEGFYFFIGAYEVTANMHVLDIDTSFITQSIKGVPNNLRQNPEAKWINGNRYILAANRDYSNIDRCIGVLCLDTIEQVFNEYYIGDHDTIEWPGLRSRLDFIDTNKIYVGGTHNFCMSSEFCSVHCWFSLNQMDTTLNVNWQHFYGGDANYTMYGIRATKDKGCLLFGSRYDLDPSSPERDIYVFKVNEDGLITSGINHVSSMVHNAIVYPNPGSANLNIESGPQVSGSEFRLTAVSGKQVISRIIRTGKTTLSTQCLHPGTYVWYIINKNKVIESGKWVKE